MMDRRTFLSGAPAILAVGTVGRDAQAFPVSDGLPFVLPVRHDGLDVVALCFSKAKIDYPFCYMLRSGVIIRAEGQHVNPGGGWRDRLPGEFDDQVIGRVVSIHLRNGSGWTTAGSGWLAG